MGRIQINAGSAVDPFAAIDDDTYRLKVVDAKEDTSKRGDPMLTLQYEVQGGDHAGHRIFDRLVITGTNRFANFRLRQLCEAAGADPDDFAPEELLNAEFDAEVRKETSEEYGDSNSVRKIFLD